jgi:hypothetical protein
MGPGWRQDDGPFSNPTGDVNVVSSPAQAYRVVDDIGRYSITPLPDGESLISLVGSIDATSPGVTAMVTMPLTFNMEIKSIFLRCTAASGVSAVAEVAAGTDGAGTNLFAPQLMTGLTASGLTYRFPTGGKLRVVLSGETFRVAVTAGATATSQTLEAHVYGRVF